jgi:hypothetical protein
MPLISPIISSRSENTSLYALAGTTGGSPGIQGPTGPTGPGGPSYGQVLASTLQDYPAPPSGMAIRGGLYYNGQSVVSTDGGNASALVIFDTTTSPTFTSLKIPDTIQTALQTNTYSILQVSGTIPLYLGPTGSVSTYKCALLRMRGVDVGTILCEPLTIWLPPASEIPNVGTTFPFTFMLKIGTDVLTTSTLVEMQLDNPDFVGGNSTIYVGGSGALSAANIIQFLIY